MDISIPKHIGDCDPMRLNSESPSDKELEAIKHIKYFGNEFFALLSKNNSPPCREMSIAKTKLEECVMWAVKGICNGEKS